MPQNGPQGESDDKQTEEQACQQEGTAEQEDTEDELTKLHRELEEARVQAAGYLDGWQRSQAEFSNYKKRQEADRKQATMFANVALLRKLLPVVDDFQRALVTLPESLSKLSWVEGVLLVSHKLSSVLESEGVETIESAGQEFDPRYHEAVTSEEVSGYAEGQIISEVQQGYSLGDWVLRPALVRVAKAPSVAVDESTADDEGNNDTEQNK